MTSIGSSAFSGCESLTSITIPESVTSIGNYAFYNSSSLTSITIPENSQLTSIGDDAFNDCYNLASITIPSSVTSIGSWAFCDCTSLNSVTIPENSQLTSIGERAFSGCSNLTSITIPSSVTSIGSWAFCDCTSLNSVTIPENSQLTSIGERAFSGCSNLTSITIPSSVTSIGEDAFSDCSSITSITIPEGSQLTIIGERAFEDCRRLTSITIPSSVESIGSYAFYNCSSLKAVINCSELNIQKGSSEHGYVGYYADRVVSADRIINDYAFKTIEDVHCLVAYMGNDTELTLPENYQGENYQIGNSAFSGCSSLTSITIPSSVTSIGDYAFSGCFNLTAVYISSLEAWCNIDFGGSSANPLCYAKKLYLNEAHVTELVIPNTVTAIKNNAFYNCTSLTSVTVPSSVTSIGSSAFYNCTGELTVNCNIPSASSSRNGAFYGSKFSAVTIGDGVTRIGSFAFYGSSSLTAITIPESVTSIGRDAFYGTAWYNNQPDGVMYIGEVLYKYKGTMPANTSIEVIEGVRSVTESAFYNCSGLTSITIPEGVTSIGSSAFYGCSSLKTVINYSDLYIQKGSSTNGYVGCYADKIVEVDEVVNGYYFKTKAGNHYLTHYAGDDTALVLPEDYQGDDYMIAEMAFQGNENIVSVEIPQMVGSIVNRVFADCINLTTINIPENSQLETISSTAFSGCSKLEEVYIGNLEAWCNIDFGTNPFSSDMKLYLNGMPVANLTELTLPNTVTMIKDKAFSAWNNLTTVVIPKSVTSVGEEAFKGCSNLSLVINYSDLYIQKGSSTNGYVGCYADKIVEVDEVVNGYYFKTKAGNHYLTHYAGDDTALVLPEDYQGDDYMIAEMAFQGNENIVSVEIPQMVGSIVNRVFADCINLTTINIPENSQLETISSTAFSGCSKLEEVYIGNLEAWCNIDFGTNPFSSDMKLYLNDTPVAELTELTIPNTVATVKNKAFSKWSNLATVIISKGVTSIGNSAFEGCSNLKAVINYSDLNLQKGSIDNGYVGYYADKVLNVDKMVNDYGFKTINDVYYLVGYIGNDTELALPENYQGDDYVIAEMAFQGDENVVSVKIPQTVGTIGSSAFAGCVNLASVEMARGVMSIEDKAFENCTSLSSVVIPQNMRSIGNSAFAGCSSLASVVFKEGVDSIGDNAFEDCAALTEIAFPKSLTAIGANAFKGCSGITSLIVDKYVERFGEGAFEGCTAVKTLIVKGSEMPTVPSSALITIVLYSPRPLVTEEFANTVYIDATLYVPNGSLESYRAADVWKKFWNITEFSTQESLSLNQTVATLTEGESFTLTATITPEFMANTAVIWSTSDASVATVDENGQVTALTVGTATITATAGNMSAVCVVTVEKKVVAVSGITLSQSTSTLVEGETLMLTATVTPDDATDKTVTWSCSNTSVAIVDANGLVVALTDGTAIITATASNMSAVCVVTVEKKNIAVSGITLSQSTATLVEGETLMLTATVTPNDATDKTVAWTTSDAAVATVDSNGVVSAVAEGSAAIIATAGGKTAVCVVTVKASKTDIEKSEIKNQKSEMIFDLQGRRVLDTENLKVGGVYIINGKKTVVM